VAFFAHVADCGTIRRMELERRQLRSEAPSDAVRIFLAQNATEAGIRAAVVSDPKGTVIGGVGDEELDELATTGCRLLSARGVAQRERLRCESGIDVTALHVVRLRVGVRSFVVTSLGAPLASAAELGAALGRIIGA
jgi:hypothetical protein